MLLRSKHAGGRWRRVWLRHPQETVPRHPGKPETAKVLSRDEGRKRACRQRTRRTSRLAAPALSLVLALALFAGAGAAGALAAKDAPSLSTGGSTLGILLQSVQPTDEDYASGEVQGNDSVLRMLMTSAEGEDVLVTYMVQGLVYETRLVGKGAVAVPPAGRIAWDPTGQHTCAGAGHDATDPHIFAGWCTDAAGTELYDFKKGVLGPLTLYAGWDVGETVDVTFDAAGGEVELADGSTVPSVTVRKYRDMPYRSLPDAVKRGHRFVGWYAERKAGEAGADVFAYPVTAATLVGHERGEGKAATVLYAKFEPVTYTIRYMNNNPDHIGADRYVTRDVTYGAADDAFLTWEEAQMAGFLPRPGKRFSGVWYAAADGTGAFYPAGGAIDEDLADVQGALVTLYAGWADAPVEGPFEVSFVYDYEGSPDPFEKEVAVGHGIAAFDDPKRAGYQFAGWWTKEEDGSYGREWKMREGDELGDEVKGDMTLYARWDLRLDVTVPVAVGFAVDADARTAVGPAADAYAIKSRTVAPVEVEEFALESREAELRGFFAAADGDGSAGAPDGSDAVGVWESGLAETALSLRGERSAASIVLPLAGERASDGGAWLSAHPLEGAERGEYSLPAFDYGATADDEAWQGADPSKRLAVAFGLSISDKLDVRLDLDGPRPITRLKVTVSAQG